MRRIYSPEINLTYIFIFDNKHDRTNTRRPYQKHSHFESSRSEHYSKITKENSKTRPNPKFLHIFIGLNRKIFDRKKGTSTPLFCVFFVDYDRNILC